VDYHSSSSASLAETMRKPWILVLLVFAGAYLWQARPGWVSRNFPASYAGAATIVGTAKVIDGDSLEIGDTRIRLHAIDAPEGRQSCIRDGAEWRCGEAAAQKLRMLVAGRALDCAQMDTDNYGRAVAVCRAGNLDLGAELVAAGLALAYRQYGDEYVDEERAAQAARRGMWAGEFTRPWDYRRGESESAPSRPSAQATPRNGCPIKGNINRSGERIYHVPGSASYAETQIDEDDGERWFCSAGQARAAGWRAPRSR
jgi:endonuclease YncB( thermonuclease family)